MSVFMALGISHRATGTGRTRESAGRSRTLWETMPKNARTSWGGSGTGGRAGMTGLVVCLAVPASAGAFGALWRRRDGRMTVRGRDEDRRLTAEAIGAEELGERATLVQFSSAFCQPCRATRRILAEVSGMVEGVAHVEIDAEARLDLVRELGVMRTPTVLVLDARGRIVRRASGQPRKVDVIAALGEAV